MLLQLLKKTLTHNLRVWHTSLQYLGCAIFFFSERSLTVANELHIIFKCKASYGCVSFFKAKMSFWAVTFIPILSSWVFMTFASGCCLLLGEDGRTQFFISLCLNAFLWSPPSNLKCNNFITFQATCALVICVWMNEILHLSMPGTLCNALSYYRPGLVTNSILICLLFAIKDRCKVVCFLKIT